MRRVSINACSRGYTARIVNVSLLSVSSASPCRGEAQRRGRAAGELLSLPRERRAERFEDDSAYGEGVAVRALRIVQAVRRRPVDRGHVRPQLPHVREVGQCRVRRQWGHACRRLPARRPHVVHVRAACHDDGVHVGDEFALVWRWSAAPVRKLGRPKTRRRAAAASSSLPLLSPLSVTRGTVPSRPRLLLN